MNRTVIVHEEEDLNKTIAVDNDSGPECDHYESACVPASQEMEESEPKV